MSHANAALTPRARLRLARLVVDHGWPVARAAERYDVSWPTAKRWADRYRRARARPGWPTGPRRPHRSPTPDPARRWSARSCTCGGSSGWARSQIGARLGHAGLDRARGAGPLPAQPALPRRPGHRRADPPLRARPPRVAAARGREEARQHPRRRRLALRRPRTRATQPGRHPGKPAQASTATRMIGHRVRAHRASTTTPGSPTPRSTTTRPPPPPSPCCAERWPGSPPAASPSSGSSPTTARAYRSHAWRDTCAELGITAKKTRPYRPQTNGKIERFHRTLADGWAFARLYNSESARRARPASMAPRVQPPPAPHRDRQGHHPSPA